jgi:hypothetical protein
LALARQGQGEQLVCAASEQAAVDQVLEACRAVEKTCVLHAIGNFRVNERKPSLDRGACSS